MLEFLRQQKFIKLNSVPRDCLVCLERGYFLFKGNFKRHFAKYLGVWVLKIPFWMSTKCMGFLSFLLLFSPISLRTACAITYPSVIPFPLITLYLLVNLNLIWYRTAALITNIWFWVFKIHSSVERKIYTILKEKILQELRSYSFWILGWLGLTWTLAIPVHSCQADRWEKGIEGSRNIRKVGE